MVAEDVSFVERVGGYSEVWAEVGVLPGVGEEGAAAVAGVVAAWGALVEAVAPYPGVGAVAGRLLMAWGVGGEGWLGVGW